MASRDNEKKIYDDFLKDAKRLVEEPGVPVSGNYSLEEILAEYGESRQQKIWADVEKQAEQPEAGASEEKEREPEPSGKRERTPEVESEGKSPKKAEFVSEPAPQREESNTAAEPESPGKEAEPESPEKAQEPLEPQRDEATPEKVSAWQPEPEESEPKGPEPAEEVTAKLPPIDALPKEESPENLEADLPEAPHPIPMEKVVGRTVDAVMEEERLLPEKRRFHGLGSRKKAQDTEQLFPEKASKNLKNTEKIDKRPGPPPIGPEEPLDKMAQRCQTAELRQKRPLPAAVILTILLTAPMVLDERGITIPIWSGNAALQTGVMLGILVIVCILCRAVFQRGFAMLRRRRCTGELLISLSAILSAADCVTRPFLSGRSAAVPYAAAACAALVFAQWGDARGSRARYDMYRTAAMGDPPYMVTDTSGGACKQPGQIRGFYTDTIRRDLPTVRMSAMLPLVLIATVVFACLASAGQGRKADFLLCWSAILTAAASFSLPLCWSLPWSNLSRQLQKCGCAVADWGGAEAISRQETMILTDADLFPPGTIRLNGIKVFGEKLSHAVSYAASMINASGNGLQRLFDDLLRSEGGHLYPLDDFSFYEEGGCSANIKGEGVLLGTASFMRKMEVRLPANLNLHTGVYLAVDHRLIAVFAVKYGASENVDWALRLLRRNHITPVLASRDPNITPALLKRKFNRGVRVEYPELSERLALSEAQNDRGLPHGLLFREGLLPYATTVVGSLRLVRSAKRSTVIALLGSAAGALLAFYLSFLGAFSLMSPATMLAFLLLWALPVLLDAGTCGRF